MYATLFVVIKNKMDNMEVRNISKMVPQENSWLPDFLKKKLSLTNKVEVVPS